MVKVILFDWGNTLMIDYPDESGPMYKWEKIAAIENAENILMSLSQKYVCCLATNAQDSSRKEIELALHKAGLLKNLKHIFCYKEIGFKKPSKEYYDAVIKILKVDKKEVLLVGDDLKNDYLGSLNYGFNAVLFDTFETVNDPGINKISSLMDLERFIKEKTD